jgi:hypothetical protein
VRLKAAKVLEELRERQPDVFPSAALGALETAEDRGRGLLRLLAELMEVDKNFTLRTSTEGLPFLVDLTMVLSGRGARRSNGCVRAIVRKYFRKTAKKNTTVGGIAKQLLPGKNPTYVPTTLRALLEFALRIPEQLADSPCLEAAPIIARYYGGDDGAALLDEILTTMNNTDRGGRTADDEEVVMLATNESACEFDQASEIDVEETGDADAGNDVLLLVDDDDEDAQQPTEEEVAGGEESIDIEHPVGTITTTTTTTPPVHPIDRRPLSLPPPPPPPAPVFIYRYQGDTTMDCLYAMRLVPKAVESGVTTLYKIGRSKDASVRRLEVSANFSETHWVSLCIVLARAGDLELYFHRELSDYRVDDLTRRRNGRALGVSREVFDLSTWASNGEDELLVKFQKLAETAIHVLQGGCRGFGGGGDAADRLRLANSENLESSADSEAVPLMKRRRLSADDLQLALEKEKTQQARVESEARKAEAEARKVEAEARKAEAATEARKAEFAYGARKTEAIAKKFEIFSRLSKDTQKSLSASMKKLLVDDC